jgi:hypothetical protein
MNNSINTSARFRLVIGHAVCVLGAIRTGAAGVSVIAG